MVETARKLTRILVSIVLISALVLVSTINNMVGALSVSNINPDKGSVEGGQEVTIYGDFNNDMGVESLSGGYYSTCVLDLGGKAYCWGSNSSGELGSGTSVADSTVAVEVDMTGVLNGKKLEQVSVGRGSSCALDTGGKAYCWGWGGYGQFGDGFMSSSLVPVATSTAGVLSGKILAQISARMYHVCALDTGGKAYCWGHGADGKLGNSATSNSSVPVEVNVAGVLGGKILTQISVGSKHTCALDSDGIAYCWGANSGGQLGNGLTSSSSVPVLVNTTGVLSGKKLKQISADYDYTCALDVDGQAYCWGTNGSGQLGSGLITSSSVPVLVDMSDVLGDKKFQWISTGEEHVCAVNIDNKVYCWGYGGLGLLGNSSSANHLKPTPVDMSGVLKDKKLISISTGFRHACVLDSKGQVYCWGYGGWGSLGNNTKLTADVPICVHGVLDGTGSALPGGCSLEYTVTMDPEGTPAPCLDIIIAEDGLSLTCTTTAHTAGIVDVTISDGVNEVTLTNGYEYVEEGCKEDCGEQGENNITSHWKNNNNKHNKNSKETLTFIIDHVCSLLDKVKVNNNILILNKDYTVSCIDDKLNITLTPEYLNTLDPDTNYPITVTFTDGEVANDTFSIATIGVPNAGIIQVVKVGGLVVGLVVVGVAIGAQRTLKRNKV